MASFPLPYAPGSMTADFASGFNKACLSKPGRPCCATMSHVGIAWKWQALDGVITKAPLGGEDTL